MTPGLLPPRDISDAFVPLEGTGAILGPSGDAKT